MILKASARGGGAQLAAHLLRTDENEHVEVDSLRGFMSSDIHGAMKEAFAISQGTRCKQHLFSLSLSPPPDQTPGNEVFEGALARIEAKLGLAGQPRILVYHEKESRRHLHACYSRIDAASMTAIKLSFFKLKLRDVSRELFLDYGYKMPLGLMNSAERDPRNFDLAAHQQSKREGRSARDLKTIVSECYAVSDGRAAFEQVLKTRGMMLARGDRRSHVVVTTNGEILSVARYTGKKTREVRAKLGPAEALYSLEDAQALMKRDMGAAFKRHTDEARLHKQRDMQVLEIRRLAISEQHRAERAKLDAGIEGRRIEETRARSDRLNRGLRGFWQRLTGEAASIQKQNDLAALAALQRDRDQRHQLVEQQLADRRALQSEIMAARSRHAEQLKEIRRDAKPYSELQKAHPDSLSRRFDGAGAPNSRPSFPLPTNEERLERLRQGQRMPRGKGPAHER